MVLPSLGVALAPLRGRGPWGRGPQRPRPQPSAASGLRAGAAHRDALDDVAAGGALRGPRRAAAAVDEGAVARGRPEGHGRPARAEAAEVDRLDVRELRAEGTEAAELRAQAGPGDGPGLLEAVGRRARVERADRAGRAPRARGRGGARGGRARGGGRAARAGVLAGRAGVLAARARVLAGRARVLAARARVLARRAGALAGGAGVGPRAVRRAGVRRRARAPVRRRLRRGAPAGVVVAAA